MHVIGIVLLILFWVLTARLAFTGHLKYAGMFAGGWLVVTAGSMLLFQAFVISSLAQTISVWVYELGALVTIYDIEGSVPVLPDQS